MKDFEKIEHLLLSKRFEELSPTEVKEVTGYFEGATDYNDMRDTLMQVKSTLAADKLLIKPNVELKEKLLQKFDNTYTQNPSNSLGKSKPFYRTIGFQWSAAASIVLIISLSIFGYIQNMNNKQNDGMAKNYQVPSANENKDVKPESITGTEESTVGKEKVSTVGPVTTNSRNVDEINQPNVVVGDMDDLREENKNLGFGNKNKNGYVTFGSNSNTNTENQPIDNSSIITINPYEAKESENREDKVKNGDFYFNGTINEKKDDNTKNNLMLKSDDNEGTYDKNNEPYKTVPVQTQSIFNYSVNKNETSTDRDYWKRHKGKEEDKKNNNGVNLGLAEQERAYADSVSLAMDSLKNDSNLQRARQLDLQKRDNK